MADTKYFERLTPLDLLMPGTYIGASLTFPTTPTTTLQSTLKQGLERMVQELPWLAGAVFRANNSKRKGLEIRWDPSQPLAPVSDKGTLDESYDNLAEQGMPPSAVPTDKWPVGLAISQEAYEIGVPVFAASFFRFARGPGFGLCICVHHNVVDATGFAEVVSTYARCIQGGPSPYKGLGQDREGRLADALSPALPMAISESAEALRARHPEYSLTPPSLPETFALSTSKLFRISAQRIQDIKESLQDHMEATPTTNNILTALLWSSISRARAQSNSELVSHTSKLVTAVDGRQRISDELLDPSNPYFGNVILYSLTELDIFSSSTEKSKESIAKICEAISQSQHTSKIDIQHIAEAYTISDSLESNQFLFPGWDLFNARDLTVTSWAQLDFYGMDFGEGLGKPDFVRVPYTEADGVCMILPRKRQMDAVDELLDVVVMLRNDDMAVLEKDDTWTSFLA